MFITATAPNPVIVSLIISETSQENELTWGMWAIAAFVPAIVSLILMPLVYLMYKPEITSTPDAPNFAKNVYNN